MYLFAPKEGSQNNRSVLLMPTHASSEEDWIMLLGYCWEPWKPQMKLELSQGSSAVCAISLASLHIGEIRIADYSVLGQHSVNFPLGSLSWDQETTLVKKSCTGRKRHLGSSRETRHAWMVCRWHKKIQYVLENTREGESVTKRASMRKRLLGSNLTSADQRPNLRDIARRWSSFLALVFIRWSS